MELVLILLLFALLLGGVGFFVEGLKWVLIFALALFLFSLVSGAYRNRW